MALEAAAATKAQVGERGSGDGGDDDLAAPLEDADLPTRWSGSVQAQQLDRLRIYSNISSEDRGEDGGV